MISVLFFGPVAERMGTSRLDLPFESAQCVQNLREQLQEKYPEAFAIVALVAVNGEHERDFSRALADGDEVVFMSAFSGG